MSLSDLIRQSVLSAIAEFDEIGRPAFLKYHGFRESRGYFVLHEGIRYDSKAIAGAAHGCTANDRRRELELRVIDLEKRLAEIEARPTLADVGTWCEGTFRRGSGVTHQGSYWIAKCDTSGKPGESRDWRLAVKRGRDGKDSPR